MKKLMIAVAAVAVGFAANAATSNWQWKYTTTGTAVTAFESATPTVAISGDMYVIFGFTGTGDANTSKENLITQLRALDGGWTEAVKGNANYLGKKATESTVGKATLTSGQLSAAVEFLEPAEAAVKQYAYAVILATDSKGNEWAYISSSANATPGEYASLNVGTLTFGVGTTSVYDLDATQTGKQAGWYLLSSSSSPVPEPTSGLLLLLGVAGLALRRKQK